MRWGLLSYVPLWVGGGRFGGFGALKDGILHLCLVADFFDVEVMSLCLHNCHDFPLQRWEF